MKFKKYSTILLFSGGVDSFCAYHYLDKPQTLYVNLKTKYSRKEKKYIERMGIGTLFDESLDLGTREVGQKAYVPFRNFYLAMLANSYSDRICIAGLKDDKVSDKNEDIFEKLSLLLSEAENRDIVVFSPFWDKTKADVVRWYLKEYGGNELDLINTVSCYSSEDTNYCGKCPCCFRKWVALRSSGIDLDFWNEDLMEEYYAAAKVGKYVRERNESIVREIDAYRGGHRWYSH